MRRQELYVLHVAALERGRMPDALARTTRVIAALGIGQTLLALEQGAAGAVGDDPGVAAEVRRLRYCGLSMARTVRALQDEVGRLLSERSLYAVHLHGVGACLLGVPALRGSEARLRVLYSPHGARFPFPWASTLLGALLRKGLAAFDYTPLAASLAEASELSRLLSRSPAVLPDPVDEAFFRIPRCEDARPNVLASGGRAALAVVTRLCVLLNGRAARVRFGWLGEADGEARARLAAASVRLVEPADDRARTQSLSRAWLFMQLPLEERSMHPVAEAMAAGVPCLAPEDPAHRALIDHGETGFVCASERDLLEKTVLLLRDRAERRRMGQAARAEAARHFTPRHFENAVLRAYGLSRGEPLEAGAERAGHVMTT